MTKEIDYLNKTEVITPLKAIVGSKWCVRCYPEKKHAEYIYEGNSLCENCFAFKNTFNL